MHVFNIIYSFSSSQVYIIFCKFAQGEKSSRQSHEISFFVTEIFIEL